MLYLKKEKKKKKTVTFKTAVPSRLHQPLHALNVAFLSFKPGTFNFMYVVVD